MRMTMAAWRKSWDVIPEARPLSSKEGSDRLIDSKMEGSINFAEADIYL